MKREIKKRTEKKDAEEKQTLSPLPMRGEMPGNSVAVEECVNLRRDEWSGNLVAVGVASRNEKLSTLPIVTVNSEAGGRMGIVKSGSRLRGVDLYGEEGSYDIGGVAGEVADVVMTGVGRGIVMTEANCYDLTMADGKWVASGKVKYPELHFEASDVMRLSVVAEERKLEGSYNTRSERLTDADADRLKKDLLKCYEELADKTNRGGMELQPVMARYRLEGEAGEVLYRSPIVQVGASSGVQCADELRCELSGDMGSRGELRLSGEVYKLRLRGGKVTGEGLEKVKRLVVETTLPVHPIAGGVAAANVLEASGANGVALRCFLPGASVTMVSARGYVAGQLMKLAMKGDAAFRDAMAVNNPFESGEAVDLEVRVARGGVKGIEKEMTEVEALLRSRVKALPAEVAKCVLPNEFVAESGCRVGDYVVWGGITVKGFQGYGIESFATTVSATGEEHSWRSVVVTELATGVSRVATSWGTENAPLKLSPILGYPRADAVKMTITLERDGVVYKGEFPLTANESHTGAYYFSETGVEIELQEVKEKFAYVVDGNGEEKYRSMVVVTSTGNPKEAIGVAQAGTGSVVKVLGVDRRGGAWEFSRYRVYVMTDSGIYLLSVGASGDDLRCNRLDRRGVNGKGGVAETDDDKYPVVCIASGDLVGLSRGNVSTLESGVTEEMVGWDRVNKELWLADKSGMARVKGTVTGGWREVGELTVKGLIDSGRGLLIDSDKGVRDTSLGEEATTKIAYRLRLEMPVFDWYRKEKRLRGVGVDMRLREVSGMLRVVSRTTAASDEECVGEMSFLGDVDMPMMMTMRGCRGSVIAVELRGEMRAGSEIREVISKS